MNENRIILGIDIGYGNCKVVYGRKVDRFGNVHWDEQCYRSITPDALVDEQALGLGNDNRVLIHFNGKSYYAGPAASVGVVGRALDPNYIDTDQHEVLLRSALHFAMRGRGRAFERIDALVLGLPVSGYMKNHEHLSDIGLRPREVPLPRFLIGQDGKSTITVQANSVLVRPQPYGALALALLEANMDDPIFDESRLTMVIDPGYRTFDWFVAAGASPEMALSGSFDGGVSTIYRELSQRIGYDHGTGSLDFDQIEDGLRYGEIVLMDKIIDMKPYIPIAKSLADKQIVAFLSRIDRNKSRVSRVLLAGGGANLYEQALRDRMPNILITSMKDSVMANARGFWIDGCHEFDGT